MKRHHLRRILPVSTKIRAILSIVLAALVLVNTACSGQENPPSKAISASPGADGGRPAHDPPRRFSPKGVKVGSGPVAIAGNTAYSYADSDSGDTSLVAVDIATGEHRWSVALTGAVNLATGPMSRNDPPTPGLVTDQRGETLIVTAYPVTVTGTGTQQDKEQTQVLAVDTSGRTRWRQAAPPRTSALPAEFVGTSRDPRGVKIVLNVGYTVTLDAGSGALSWTNRNVIPRGVDGDKVIGFQRGDSDWASILVGLRGQDGGLLWTGPESRTAIAGQLPALVMAGPGRVVSHTSKDGRDALFDTANGRKITILTPLAPLGTGDYDCLFDQRDTIVCTLSSNLGNEGAEQTLAFDARSGRRLWKLPDTASGRTALEVSHAFHGAVYGDAGEVEQRPVVLDARSGADRVTDATALSVTRAVPGYGLIIGEETMAYPSIG